MGYETNTRQELLYIIIPAYNEAENIADVINDWYPIVEKFSGGGYSRLVIIDDGSQDHTYSMVKKMEQSKPLLKALTKKNSGHGATIMEGYQYALEHKADWIFQTDSDGQTEASEFEAFWNLRKDFDMVIGYRKYRKDGIQRIIVTKVLRFVIWCCFGIWVLDANTPYRLMSQKSLKENLKYIPSGFHLSNILLSVIYMKRGQSVKFKIITFKNRQKGCNSLNMKKITKIGIQAFRDFRVINKRLKTVGFKKNE